MYQKCPICNGEGFVNSYGMPIKCSTCNGLKIIDTITGRPPVVDPIVNEQGINHQNYSNVGTGTITKTKGVL